MVRVLGRRCCAVRAVRYSSGGHGGACRLGTLLVGCVLGSGPCGGVLRVLSAMGKLARSRAPAKNAASVPMCAPYCTLRIGAAAISRITAARRTSLMWLMMALQLLAAVPGPVSVATGKLDGSCKSRCRGCVRVRGLDPGEWRGQAQARYRKLRRPSWMSRLNAVDGCGQASTE